MCILHYKSKNKLVSSFSEKHEIGTQYNSWKADKEFSMKFQCPVGNTRIMHSYSQIHGGSQMALHHAETIQFVRHTVANYIKCNNFDETLNSKVNHQLKSESAFKNIDCKTNPYQLSRLKRDSHLFDQQFFKTTISQNTHTKTKFQKKGEKNLTQRYQLTNNNKTQKPKFSK